ncbi:MFS transporter [Comamonas sp.]|uniref:MFS transporter n=1 Tax=Comamonas sp. TaxID=34028 RepID=UPI0028963F24|nr:MFS transporter [Comamonas sp.]
MNINPSVARLALAQALSGANTTVVYATGAIIGHMLAPRPELATLPITMFVVGMAISTLPAGQVARRYGRARAFQLGNLSGVLMGLIASLAIVQGSFALYCLATLFGGAYAAVVLSFRFAAAECVSPEEKPKALSTVLAGGVLAGVVGPQLVSATMNAWPPYAYSLTYICSSIVAVLSAIVLRGVQFQTIPPRSGPAVVRPLAPIVRQPQFVVALLCGTVSYLLMNFMMTSAPLAMELCGISRAHSNYGIEMHVIAMYAPSFFTGSLIKRFGESRIIFAGLVLTALAAITGLAGISVSHFWVGLVLLGLGWNFGFLGASALVLKCHAPEDGPRVQSLNDFVVFGAMAVGSFASGSLLTTYGWDWVVGPMLPLVLLAVLSLAWLARVRRSVKTSP